jgi:beta-phosphoglucomutase-like phosphatase (HAD superfamily)
LRVPSDECWAFEDSRAGCQSALEAGCWVWHLVTEANQADLFQHSRLATISSLSEGEEYLRQSLNTSG